MFADPQSVTVNAVPISLPAIARNESSSEYGSADGNYTLQISRTDGKKRDRFLIRLNMRKIAANPFDTSKNEEYTQSVYLVMDAPVVGFTPAETKDLALGLAGFASSANLLKVLGRET